MEYFNDVLITFLGLERVSWVAVLKMNDGLMGLERHEVE